MNATGFSVVKVVASLALACGSATHARHTGPVLFALALALALRRAKRDLDLQESSTHDTPLFAHVQHQQLF